MQYDLQESNNTVFFLFPVFFISPKSMTSKKITMTYVHTFTSYRTGYECIYQPYRQ